jgi:hypothetical protein
VVPLIADGGNLIAVSIALAPMTPTGPDSTNNLPPLGTTTFKLFPIGLAGLAKQTLDEAFRAQLESEANP